MLYIEFFRNKICLNQELIKFSSTQKIKSANIVLLKKCEDLFCSAKSPHIPSAKQSCVFAYNSFENVKSC